MSRSTGEFEVVDGNVVPLIAERVVSGAEVSDVAINYMDTLRMERALPEVPVYELEPMVKEPVLELTEVHINDEYFDGLLTETADTIISLPDCDGMSDEFLLNQPLDAIHMYLEEIVKEVHTS